MNQVGEGRIVRFETALLAMDTAGIKLMLTEFSGLSLSLAEALIVPALERIGRGWEEGRYALSQVYMSGRQCEALMNSIQPDIAVEQVSGPRMAIAALEDYHLLGMRLVSSVLRASGFPLLDYGRMDVDSLADRVADAGVDILLISVLMLRSALRVRDLRRKLGASGHRVALAVGGAPFRLDKELWREVGADGTSDTAAGAVALVKRLAEEREN
ncbi:MAG: cobalamin-binding protein [Spirochaetales bacterium]|nr:MAG: cobalamin-binding protein [Spirochaetales bacterium]